MTFTTPTDPGPAGAGTAGSVAELSRSVALVGTLLGALRSGLIESLVRWQPCTSAELATRAHLPARTVDLVLHTLDAGGVAVRCGQEWSLTAPPATWAELADAVDRIGVLVEARAEDELALLIARLTVPTIDSTTSTPTKAPHDD